MKRRRNPPGTIVAFVLCLPFKAIGLLFKALAAFLRFCLGTRSLKDYFEKRFEEKRLRHIMKVGGNELALIEAARSAHIKMVKMLLQSGASVDTRSRALIASASGGTHAGRGYAYGHREVCQALLQSGANVRARDGQGMTALIQAARAGEIKIMRLLLEAGADVNARDDEHGWTPLLALLSEPHSEWTYVPAAEVLLQAKADLSVKGKDGRTALDRARGRRVEKLVHLLGDPSFVARTDMNHDVFGPISYKMRDQVWIGKCSLPRFAEYGSNPDEGQFWASEGDDFRQERFGLTIRDTTGDGPTKEQTNSFQYLKQNEAQVCEAVGAALLESANYGVDPPRYHAAADLKPIARCTGVEFSTEHIGTHAYCAFSFDNIWEMEHGLAIVYHPDKGASWGDSTALDNIG
jgi:Ankyrin repeats (3 copies)/Domain of unknown function (DUF6985)